MCQRTGVATPKNLLTRRASGHRREDHEGVALAHRGVQPLEHADVLVVEVDVDVAVELATVREQLRLRAGMRVDQRPQDLAHVASSGGDLLLASDRRAQDGWDLDRR